MNGKSAADVLQLLPQVGDTLQDELGTSGTAFEGSKFGPGFISEDARVETKCRNDRITNFAVSS